MPSAEGQSGGDPPQNTGTGGESSGSQPQLPDRVIVRLLQREYLLMLGGLHLLHLRMFHGAEDLKLLTKHESTVSTVNHSTSMTKLAIVQHSTTPAVKHFEDRTRQHASEKEEQPSALINPRR